MRADREATSISRAYLIAGVLLTAAAGLLCALVAFGIVLLFGGHPTEGGYCSHTGIGSYEPAWERAVYVDDGWSGLLPSQHCSVYLAAETGDDQSRRLLAEGAYPGTWEYAWVAGAFLLPFAIWGLFLATARLARRRNSAEAGRH